MDLAKRLALLLASLLVVLFVAEGVARWSETGPGPPRVSEAREDLPSLDGALELSEPNLSGLYRGTYYRTNSLGLRGPEYAPEPEPGTFRIVVGGDSVTAGSGVEEGDAYPSLLEEMLNADPPPSAPPVRFEVINLGLSGVNAGYVMERIDRFGRLLGARLHVYGFTVNDIDGRHYRALPPPEGLLSEGDLYRRMLRFRDSPSALLRSLWPRAVLLWEAESVEQFEERRLARMKSEFELNYFENPKAWGAFDAALARAASDAAERRVCFHVLLHTNLRKLGPDYRFHDINAHVAEAARAKGLGVSESYPFFEGRAGGEFWVGLYDTHPNAEGHALLARALHEGLRELPARCWRLRGFGTPSYSSSR